MDGPISVDTALPAPVPVGTPEPQQLLPVNHTGVSEDRAPTPRQEAQPSEPETWEESQPEIQQPTETQQQAESESAAEPTPMETVETSNGEERSAESQESAPADTQNDSDQSSTPVPTPETPEQGEERETSAETQPAEPAEDEERSTAGDDETNEDEEPATWVEYEEDDSAPTEEELQEIYPQPSAVDYDHWESKFFIDPEDPEFRPIEKARLTWKIKGVRGTKERPNRAQIMRSPPAWAAGYWWTIKFFPRGNDVSSLSIYVECSREFPELDKTIPDTDFKVLRGPPDASLQDCEPDIQVHLPAAQSTEWCDTYKKVCEKAGHNCSSESSQGEVTSPDWRVSAEVGLILYNPDEPRTRYTHTSSHQFNPNSNDWGWTNFHGPWDEIHRRQRGQYQALLRNDTLAFDAYIRIFDDPTKTLWWHSCSSERVWDSYVLTGYRPLGDYDINHSVEVAALAAWVHLAPFRKIIRDVDILEHLSNCLVKPRPVCAALQEVIWRLGSQDEGFVNTDKLTGTLRNLQEYSSDAVEFWERLRRSLELELEGTPAKDALAQLFDSPKIGVQEVNALPGDPITRIRVTVDKGKSVQDLVQGYLDKKPGRWSLPPVLHIELNRHRFSNSSRQWKLMYDKVDLSEVLDVSSYVADGKCGRYDLYGFIVHRGRRTSQKFFSILRPGGPGSKWLAFDDGPDNRVECLTRKAALENHVGPHQGEWSVEQSRRDCVVAVLYVRHDVVGEYLPGPVEEWKPPSNVVSFFHSERYRTVPEESESESERTVQVEVYSLPSKFNEEELGSLFDAYDLMSVAKRNDNVLSLTVPQNTTLAELRKKVALAKSTETEKISSDRVRLWEIGDVKPLFPATVLLNRLFDLTETLNQNLTVVRYWMHILSGSNIYFSIPDPMVASQEAESQPDQESIPAAPADAAETTDVTMTDAPPAGDAPPAENSANDAVSTEGPKEPPPHIYYFIQWFDVEKQAFVFKGGFFSALDDSVVSEIRRHLQLPEDKRIQVWSRVDATYIASTEYFPVPARDCFCYIVGEKLTKEQRTNYAKAGLLTDPDQLAQYLWAAGRRHPVRAFSGHKTIEATFNGDYYSGEFLKGYYNGTGTHISDNGTTYTGEFLFGKRHGTGKMEYPSGDTYEGDWADDQRHGQGTFVEKATGNKYVGGYKDGKRHGKGVTFWEVADEEMDLCQICYAEEKNALIYDCGHVCACLTCANRVDVCPICRKNVIRVIQIYKT